MALTLKNIFNDYLHHFALLLGILAPIFLVLGLFIYSHLTGARAYIRYYTDQGHFIEQENLDSDSILMIPQISISKICWLNVDFIKWFLLIPVAFILFFNLVAMMSAVFAAYKSATFR